MQHRCFYGAARVLNVLRRVAQNGSVPAGALEALATFFEKLLKNIIMLAEIEDVGIRLLNSVCRKA